MRFVCNQIHDIINYIIILESLTTRGNASLGNYISLEVSTVFKLVERLEYDFLVYDSVS